MGPRRWRSPPRSGPMSRCSTSRCRGSPGSKRRQRCAGNRPAPACSSSACTTIPSMCARRSARAWTAICSRTAPPPSWATRSAASAGAKPSSARRSPGSSVPLCGTTRARRTARWRSSRRASGRCCPASRAARPTRRLPTSSGSATARSRATARA